LSDSLPREDEPPPTNPAFHKRFSEVDTPRPILKRIGQLVLIEMAIYLLFGVFLAHTASAPLLLSLAFLAVCLTGFLLVKEMFSGYMVNDICMGLVVLGAFLFVAGLLWGVTNQSSELDQGAIAFALVGAMSALVVAVRTRYRAYYPIMRAVAIASVSLPFFIISPALVRSGLDFGSAIAYAMIVAAPVSLLSLFKNHSNPNMRILGRYLSNDKNMIFVALMSVLFFEYVIILRPLLAQRSPDAVVLFEWFFVALVAGYAAYYYRSYLNRISQDQLVGDWRSLMQTMKFDKGNLADSSRSVRLFLEEGESEGLIVLLISVMLQNGLSTGRIEGLLQGLVRYRTEEAPPLMLRWTYGDYTARVQEARMRVLMSALQGMAEALNARHLVTAMVDPKSVMGRGA
jgi:hypothetical protein